MWLSGRRAVRPDRDYYRNVRRARLRVGTRSRTREVGALAVAVLAVGGWLVIWLFLRLSQ